MSLGKDKPSEFDFSRLQASVNKYYEKQLDSLGLSMKVLRQDSEESLHRKLIAINHAIENHESFGKFGVRVTTDVGAILVNNKSEALFEIGILPLLLKRNDLILERLGEFDRKTKKVVSESKVVSDNIRKELMKIAKSDTNRRLWFVIGAMVILWGIMFFLIEKFGWNLLEPLTYLLGIALAIGGYAYFAIKQREFSPWTIYQHALETRRKYLFQIFGVEEE
jgi:hypothetical protein